MDTYSFFMVIVVALVALLIPLWIAAFRKERRLAERNIQLTGDNAMLHMANAKLQEKCSELEGQVTHATTESQAENAHLQQQNSEFKQKIEEYEPTVFFVSNYEYDLNLRLFVRAQDKAPVCTRCYLESQESVLKNDRPQPYCEACGATYKDIG